jgi:hypothetical protein
MNHPRVYAALLATLRTLVPGFTTTTKLAGPWWMRAVAWVLTHVARMRDFTTAFTTTIGPVVYYGTEAATEVGTSTPPWDTLAHEGVHAYDDRHSVPYKATYLLPQLLAVLAVFSVLAWPLSSWWLLNLGWLLALAPWPSPGRVHWERRGYLMSMVCDVVRYGEAYVRSPAYQAHRAQTYTGGSYWFMAWGKAKVRAFVDRDIEQAIAIVKGRVTVEPHSTLLAAIRGAA